MAKGKVLNLGDKIPPAQKPPAPTPEQEAAAGRSDTQRKTLCPLLTRVTSLPVPNPLDQRKVDFLEHVSQVNCNTECELFDEEVQRCSLHAKSRRHRGVEGPTLEQVATLKPGGS